MSKEQVESFLKKVHEDEALAKEFQKCFEVLQNHKDAPPQDQEKMVLEAAVALGKSKGFDFDADEAHRAYRSATDQEKRELSDEELEQVAGGKSVQAQCDAQMVTARVLSWATAGVACAAMSGIGAAVWKNAKVVGNCMGNMIGKPPTDID